MHHSHKGASIYFIFAAMFIGCSDVPSEKTFSDDLVLLTQQEIEAFASLGYSHIEGSLTIGEYRNTSSDIKSLLPLHHIKTISGDLEIWYNDNLESLNGLDGLSKIRELKIEKNPMLINLEGLDQLDSLGSLIVRYNDGLESLQGLETLRLVAELFEINGNQSLESVEISSPVLLPIMGDFVIVDNPSVRRIAGFERMTLVGDLEIRNTSIENLNTFQELISTRKIQITENPNLRSISGFQNIRIVGGQLALFDNPALSSVSAFNGVEYVDENFILASLPALQSLAPFAHLFGVVGNFLIYDTSIENLSGLERLQSVEGDFVVSRNQDLVDFCSIQNIISEKGIKGALTIEENGINPSIQDLESGVCN